MIEYIGGIGDYITLNCVASKVNEIIMLLNGEKEILCNYSRGCESRVNGKCDRLNPFGKYVPHIKRN